MAAARPALDLDLRAELAVLGVRSTPPLARRGGAGPSDDGHWAVGGSAVAATLPVVADSPFELIEGGVLTRDGVVIEDALLEP
ncbi:MAG: family radical protein, partial [Solirubrobacterales bacterium]|nr:family radical protein [Solirubrobacterales bacterium]